MNVSLRFHFHLDRCVGWIQMACCDESFSSLGGAFDGFRWLAVMNFSFRIEWQHHTVASTNRGNHSD